MNEPKADPRAEGAPISVEADGVHAEPRKTGHRLLDFSIALSAIVISLISLSVGIHHGRVQERLVAANSWPFLTWKTSNESGDDGQFISFAINNSGVGPAVLKSLVVRYDGKPVRGWVELLHECCGLPRTFTVNDLPTIGVVAEDAPKGVIRARESTLLLKLRRLPERPQLWEQLVAARLKLQFDACYCSIIGECWKSDLHTLDPVSTEQCTAGPDDYVELGAGLDGSSVVPVMRNE